jgi:peptidoglycan/xylan/chitin deacetylase (PgdA/CDA1 family)
MPARLALKIDVDTDRGTREGILPLARLLKRHEIPASFFFSLGPDNTGRAIRRVFRPGFFKKVMRTNVAGNYGWRTLMNGTVLPAPHVGRKNTNVMRDVAAMGFETGIHCYDHFTWQDYVHVMTPEKIRWHLARAREEYERIFGKPARAAAAPGWQANEESLLAYEEAGFDYGSDTRGQSPFLPLINGRASRTAEIPTSMPTLDELAGRPEFPDDALLPHYGSFFKEEKDHVHTIHAELEGMAYLDFFHSFLEKAVNAGVAFETMESRAARLDRSRLPVLPVVQGTVDGRSGLVAVPGSAP